MLNMRIGQGFDSHRLVAGDGLKIGGVFIPCAYRLDGHSDADVLVHAVIDALLGALSLGNIGQCFPDDDATYKEANSLDMLKAVYEKIRLEGYALGNLDATLIAQTPKLNPYLSRMVTRIAQIMTVDEVCVSVKAKSNEGMGFVGRKEGVVALVCLYLMKVWKV